MKINKNEKYTQEQLDNSIGTSNTYLSNFYQLKIPLPDEFWELLLQFGRLLYVAQNI